MGNQFVHNSGDASKYGLFVPRMVIEDLEPYHKALWLHYANICADSKTGACFEKVETTARKAKMAAGMVTKIRDQLEAMGLIRVSEHPVYKSKVIEMVDLWPQNMERYGSDSLSESIVVVFTTNTTEIDLSVLENEQQQQFSFISVHSMKLPPRLQFLADQHNLLEDVTRESLIAWIAQYGADRVIECARWYCFARDVLGKAESGGWLRCAIEQGYTKPKGFQDHMYLSEADKLDRFGGWGD